MSWSRIATSVGSQFVGRIAGFFVSLVSVGLLTRYLGVTSFGEYATALAIASLVTAFADFGFFWSTIENYLKDGQNSIEAVREIFGIRFVMTVVLVLAALALVWFGDYSTAVKNAFLVLTVFVLSNSLNNVFIALYQAEYKMVYPTVVEQDEKVSVYLERLNLAPQLTFLIPETKAREVVLFLDSYLPHHYHKGEPFGDRVSRWLKL